MDLSVGAHNALLFREALYQGTASAVPGDREKGPGFSPGGFSKASVAKAFGRLCVAARLKPCPDTKPATRFPHSCGTPPGPPVRFMLALVCTLVLAFASAGELVNQVYTIPADEWRYVDLGVGQRPALVEAEYEVRAGSDQVRLAVMRRDDLEHLREGLAHGVVEATEPGRSGKLTCQVRPPGEYVVVVDNRDDRAAVVRLRIRLDFPPAAGSLPERLSPQRRLTVILVSFAAFFAIVTWSGRKLLPPVRR